MLSRNQLLNDAEEAMRVVLSGWQRGLWTAMPGIVKAVNLTKMTVSVQPAIQAVIADETGATENVDLPLLTDVPIVFPSAGGFTITFPVAVGNEVLVVFASRAIDSWWSNGGYQNLPVEARMHDLSDGFAIPGPHSQTTKISVISSTDLEVRNNAGNTYLSVTAGGKVGFANATTDLKTVLTDLETLLNTFMTVLQGFSGGGTAVSQAMLQAPAAAAVTSLAAVLTKIGALLK